MVNFHIDQDVRSIALLESHIRRDDRIVAICHDRQFRKNGMFLAQISHLFSLTLFDKSRELRAVQCSLFHIRSSFLSSINAFHWRNSRKIVLSGISINTSSTIVMMFILLYLSLIHCPITTNGR